jgi:hypothetical protein
VHRAHANRGQNIVKIEIGKRHDGAGERAQLDIQVFLRTRMLVQAASGQGKSHWLRRLCEQLFGKVQIFIIDVEGEFATLRPTFDFAIIGEGGDAPADVRSAALLAQKLLELRTSAIFDLSEAFRKHPRDRHTWVKNFLGSMMEAPKRLWHPTVVVVDEAHKFAPEKDESEASDAMISLTTDGRKRQFCAVFATQRLGKLSKDAAAELLNKMIGGTSLDIDRKRAADDLGVYGKDLRPFNNEIKVIPRGFFWCLGPAISKERLLTYVGPTETASPEVGTRASLEPPPPTAKIKAMLPQLADLPKLAVEKQQTEAELRSRIRELERKVQTSLKVAVQHSTEKPGAIHCKIEIADLDELLRPVIERHSEATSKFLEGFRQRIHAAVDAQQKNPAIEWKSLLVKAAAELNRRLGSGTTAAKRGVREGLAQASSVQVPTFKPSPRLYQGDKIQTTRKTIESIETPEGVTRPQGKILESLAQLDSVGQDKPTRGAVAFFAGTRPTSSSFEKNVGSLRTKGLIEFPAGATLALTNDGRAIARAEAIDSQAVVARSHEILTTPERRIFEAVHAVYPEAITREDLAERSESSHSSSSFEKNVGKLKTATLLTYPSKGTVRAADWLFF